MYFKTIICFISLSTLHLSIYLYINDFAFVYQRLGCAHFQLELAGRRFLRHSKLNKIFDTQNFKLQSWTLIMYTFSKTCILFNKTLKVSNQQILYVFIIPIPYASPQPMLG